VRRALVLGGDVLREEHFGPASFIITHDSAAAALTSAADTAHQCGAIATHVYSTNPEFQDQAEAAFVAAGASTTFNLCGPMPLNYAAALRGEALFVSAATGGFIGPNEIWRVDLGTLRSRLVARVKGASGPIAFDGAGNRLGMGAGHYDRTFAYRRHRTIWRRPWLVGVAFACQRSAGIAPQPWDVRLDAVVTETGVVYFV